MNKKHTGVIIDRLASIEGTLAFMVFLLIIVFRRVARIESAVSERKDRG